MRVREWMTLDVVTVTPQTSVLTPVGCSCVTVSVVFRSSTTGVGSSGSSAIGIQVHDPLLLGCLSALQSDLSPVGTAPWPPS